MTKDELLKKINELLKTDIELNFLLSLKKKRLRGWLLVLEKE